MSDRDETRQTRRALLQGVLAAAILTAAPVGADAQQKADPKVVQYQQKPKGDQECDKCLHFEPPESCKLVAGKINPKGWCMLYVPKPK